MKNSKSRPYYSLTNFKIISSGIVALLFGLLCLYLSGSDTNFWKSHQGFKALVNEVGALLVIAVALGAVWELIGKRAFARELLETTKTATEVETAGLKRIVTNYLSEPDWEELFRNIRELDIFFAYGQTWRNSNLGRLQSVAQRSDGRISVYLPDPKHELTINMLAERFATTPEELTKKIADTKRDFEALRVPGGATIQVFYYPGDRTFSFYRLDHTVVMTLYKHKPGRSPVLPTLICEANGTLYEFIRAELEAINAQSRSADNSSVATT